jgi:hypothetical protein
MNNLPVSIDDVLRRLDDIIPETIHDNNYLGIFAYVYRRTTAEIKQAIVEKQFEDNDRMERMDVTFANKYLTAYQDFRTGSAQVSGAWAIPFSAAHEKHTVMQHLLMGMNAHINLDLGIAAAETTPGSSIHTLKNDFMKVNEILASLTNEMQVRVGRISWWMFLLDWLTGKNDEAVINFSMVKAREAAWDFACRLAVATGEERKAIIGETDTTVSALAEIIRRPPGLLLRNVLRFIARFEEKKVERIIAGLQQ